MSEELVKKVAGAIHLALVDGNPFIFDAARAAIEVMQPELEKAEQRGFERGVDSAREEAEIAV